MKTDYIKRACAFDAFCKDCKGLERGECEYYGNGCKTIETLLSVRSEAVVPKDFHDKTCEAMAKRHAEEIQKFMWIPCYKRLPSGDGPVLVNVCIRDASWKIILMEAEDVKEHYKRGHINAWMPVPQMYEEGDHDYKSEQTEQDGLQMNMEEYKVRLGEDVVLDLGIAPDWYISALSYDRASVTITLRSDNLLLANKLLPGEEIYMKQLLDEKSQTVLQSGG